MNFRILIPILVLFSINPLTLFSASNPIDESTEENPGLVKSDADIIQTMETTNQDRPDDEAIDLDGAFMQLFAIQMAGGLQVYTKEFYALRFKTGPAVDLAFRYFPDKLRKKKIWQDLSFLVQAGFAYTTFYDFSDAFWNEYTLTVGAEYEKKIWRDLYAFGGVTLGYYLNHFYAPMLDTEQTRFIQGAVSRVFAGVGYAFQSRFDVKVGAVWTMQVDRAFPHGPNHRITPMVTVGMRFEKPTPRLTVEEIKMDDLFAVLQKYYQNHPVAEVTVTNNSGVDLEEVRVNIIVPGFMDGPTQSEIIPVFPDGEQKIIPMTVALNDNVYNLTSNKSVNVQVKVEYKHNQKMYYRSNYVDIEMYHRNAMTWDDDRKLASFVTPLDVPVSSFSRGIVQGASNLKGRKVNSKVFDAMVVYEACAAHGVQYIHDPNSPLSGNALAVDYIQYARDMLKEPSGDCDDLTVLYCTLLESVGIETAFVTVPGHIFMMFNTKVSEQDVFAVAEDLNRVYILDGEVWVPVEVTAIGRKPFDIAWEWGADQVQRVAGTNSITIIKVVEAQGTFPPVPFPESEDRYDTALSSELSNRLVQSHSILEEIANIRTLDDVLTELEADPNNPALLNEAGMLWLEENQVQVEAGSDGVAARQSGNALKNAMNFFKQALSYDANYYDALFNLALVYIEQEDWVRAEQQLNTCMQHRPDDMRVYTAMSIVLEHNGGGW